MWAYLCSWGITTAAEYLTSVTSTQAFFQTKDHSESKLNPEFFSQGLPNIWKTSDRPICISSLTSSSTIHYMDARLITAVKMETADLVLFTGEILNGKLHFCTVYLVRVQMQCSKIGQKDYCMCFCICLISHIIIKEK